MSGYGSRPGVQTQPHGLTIVEIQQWDRLVAQGQELWSTWAEKTGPDKPHTRRPSPNLQVTMKTSKEFPLQSNTKDTLEGYILTEGELEPANFFEIEVDLPTEGAKVKGAMNVEAGLFVVDLLNHNSLPRYHQLDFLSVGWWMWYTAVENHDPSSLASNLHTLTYFVLEDLDEPSEHNMMDFAMGYGPIEGKYTFTRREPGPGGAFWMLLGLVSNHVISIMRMITDYKHTLQGKGVVSITIRYDQDEDADYKYVIVVELGHAG